MNLFKKWWGRAEKADEPIILQPQMERSDGCLKASKLQSDSENNLLKELDDLRKKMEITRLQNDIARQIINRCVVIASGRALPVVDRACSDNSSGNQASVEARFANSTTKIGCGAAALDDPRIFQSENDLSPVVKARLTDVVRGLRASWIAGPASFWGDIYTINPMSVTGLDQRVTSPLRDSFLCFSQFLAGLEQLLLDCDQLGAEREERFLSLEKLVVHRDSRFFQESIIPTRDDPFADVLGCVDGAESDRERR
jgi:hypothetical protein